MAVAAGSLMLLAGGVLIWQIFFAPPGTIEPCYDKEDQSQWISAPDKGKCYNRSKYEERVISALQSHDEGLTESELQSITGFDDAWDRRFTDLIGQMEEDGIIRERVGVSNFWVNKSRIDTT